MRIEVKGLKNDNNLIFLSWTREMGMNKSDYLEKMDVISGISSKLKILSSAKELDNIEKLKAKLLSF